MAQALPLTGSDPITAMGVAPSGPGILLAEVVDFSDAGLKAAAAGDESRGIHLGMLTSPPEITEDPDVQNLLDNVSGLPVELVGAKQPGTQTAEITAEVVEIDQRRLKYLQPGQGEESWLNAAHATLAIGSGDSRFSVTSKTAGVGGNSTSIALVVPATTNAALSVAVSGSAITVNLATGATASVSTSTANQVIAAINAHAGASLLVRAGLSGGSKGTGVVAAQASTPLAGGTAGTAIGKIYQGKSRFASTDYIKNITFVCGTTFQDIYLVYELRNAMNVDTFGLQADENGAVTGVSITWRGHATSADRDPATGAYRPPIRKFLMDAAAVV